VWTLAQARDGRRSLVAPERVKASIMKIF